MQPSLRVSRTRRKTISAFKGLSLRATVPDGYFADAENVTTAEYPAIKPRAKRAYITDCGTVSSMFMHNEMVWVDDGALYYGSSYIGNLTAGEKQFATLGSTVVIYPDKVCLNTQTRTLRSIESYYSHAGATVYPSDADGNLQFNSPYVKVFAQGIDSYFNKGDCVSISGFSSTNINGDYVIQNKGTDFIVVLFSVNVPTIESGTVYVRRTAPDLDFICSLNNRVWGCRADGNEIYACKLGDPLNWNCFEGISTDAYVATAASPGAFTGLTSNLGNVIFFKENEILKVYGNKPSNFQIVSSRMPGIRAGAANTLAYTGSTLFYLGLSGIFAYDGSEPVCISYALGDNRFTEGCAGAYDGKYYASLYNATLAEWQIYVYDAQTGIWVRESGGHVKFFAGIGTDLYFALYNSRIYSVNRSGLWYDPDLVPATRGKYAETGFSWYAQSGAISLTAPDGQFVTRLHMRVTVSNAATLKVYLRYSADGDWTQAASIEGPAEDQLVSIPVQAVRASSFYWKVSGTDMCVIKSVTMSYETGGEI